MQSATQMFVARFASRDPLMQSAMQMFVTRFASRDPLMQSAMQMFVTRFASRDPCILPVASLLLQAKCRGLSTTAAKTPPPVEMTTYGKERNEPHHTNGKSL